MKITKQLQYTVIGLIGFAALSSLVLDLAARSGQKDGAVVNHSGIVRGATQRWVKLELQQKPNQKLEDKVDSIIQGLLNGDKERGLPKATDAAYRDKMLEVQKEWQLLQQLVADYRAGNANEQAVLRESEEFFELTNDAVFLSQDISTKNVTQSRITNVMITLLNVAVLAFVGYTLNRASSLLQGSVSTMAGRSQEIDATIRTQEKTIQDQTVSVKSTTMSMEELGSNTMQTASKALASARDAQNALEIAKTGSETVEKTTTGMRTLKDQVEDIAKQIIQLSEQTAQIQSISNLVSDVADQTNMLALNAAVEAARAGEQGKGFAVVAGEIRKLADQSGRSADKINTLISDIQASINSTIMVTDEGTKTASSSLELADATNDAFVSIRSAMENVSRTNEQMAEAAKLQAVTVQQSVSSMNAINLGAQEVSNSAKKVKESTGDLNSLSKELSLAV